MNGIVGLVGLLSSLLHTGLCITCYSCNNDPYSSGPYDPNCDTDGYDGNTINSSVHQTCYTDIYDDGSLYRGVDYDEHEDGTCSIYGSSTICFCASNECNNNLCEHCDGGKPTTHGPVTTREPTTEQPITTPDSVTSTSQQPTDAPATTGILTTEQPITTPGVSTDGPSTTKKFTTINPTYPPTTNLPTTDDPITDYPTTNPLTTHEPTTDVPTTNPPTTVLSTTEPQTTQSTTEIDTTTPTPPVISLACYDCQNSMPEYDNYDEKCGEDDYTGMTYTCNNCFSCTVQVHDDGVVFRGEAGQFADGECASGVDVDDGGNYLTCYCTSDLCNTDLCQHCDP